MVMLTYIKAPKFPYTAISSAVMPDSHRFISNNNFIPSNQYFPITLAACHFSICLTLFNSTYKKVKLSSIPNDVLILMSHSYNTLY